MYATTTFYCWYFGSFCKSKKWIKFVQTTFIHFHFFKVTFLYGYSKNIRLTLGNDIEIVEKLEAHEVSWITVPEKDIRRNENENVLNHCPGIEIELTTPVLKDNVSIAVPPDCHVTHLTELLNKQHRNILPIVIYGISENVLSDVVRITDILYYKSLAGLTNFMCSVFVQFHFLFSEMQ